MQVGSAPCILCLIPTVRLPDKMEPSKSQAPQLPRNIAPTYWTDQPRKLHQNPLLKATTAGISRKTHKNQDTTSIAGILTGFRTKRFAENLFGAISGLLVARLRYRSSPKPHVVNLSLNPCSAKAPDPTLQSSVALPNVCSNPPPNPAWQSLPSTLKPFIPHITKAPLNLPCKRSHNVLSYAPPTYGTFPKSSLSSGGPKKREPTPWKPVRNHLRRFRNLSVCVYRFKQRFQ